MVPGSTFRYGSNFIRLTLSPRLSSRQPIEAAAKPFPRDETTPPVTKMYLEDTWASAREQNLRGSCTQCFDWIGIAPIGVHDQLLQNRYEKQILLLGHGRVEDV